MSASDLLDRLQNIRDGESIDWQAIREEIHREADKPITTEERVILLEIFRVVFDRVERELSAVDPEKLQGFQNARLGDYRLLLIKEAMVGENVCADTLYAITEREVAAGRLAPDDSLRTLTAERIAEPHPTRAELIAMIEQPSTPKGLFSRFFRK